MMPRQIKLTIENILNNDDEKMAFATVGESVTMIVKNVDPNELRRGNVICGS